jgi:hypothetical protein
MRARNSLAALLWLVCAGAHAQDIAADETKNDYISYAAPSGQFACARPRNGWQTIEGRDALGEVIYFMGPENPAKTYRTGYSIRWMNAETPGFIDAKHQVDFLRATDKATGQRATPVRPMRVAGLLARTFEILETRVLPADKLPASESELHHYVAVIPSGAGYYLIRLSATRDVYLDYRDEWIRFLKSFQPVGS